MSARKKERKKEKILVKIDYRNFRTKKRRYDMRGETCTCVGRARRSTRVRPSGVRLTTHFRNGALFSAFARAEGFTNVRISPRETPGEKEEERGKNGRGEGERERERYMRVGVESCISMTARMNFS